MKKKILVCIVFFMACFLNVNSLLAFDAGSCIDGFGTMTLASTGNNTANSGKVDFSNRSSSLSTWDNSVKTFDTEITAKSGYKIKEIVYRISSKDGYSCNGVITGSDIEKGYVKLSVTINKENSWVDDISFYANMQKNGSDETKFTPKKTIKVKYNNVVTTTFKQDESMTCQFLEDVFGEYWNWVLILAPVATIILITIDFVGCLLSSDAEAMKKAGDKTIKRTIALVLLLMLPIVLKLIFNLFGLDICG